MSIDVVQWYDIPCYYLKLVYINILILRSCVKYSHPELSVCAHTGNLQPVFYIDDNVAIYSNK